MTVIGFAVVANRVQARLEMAVPRFQSVDDYLASLDAMKAATLRALIDLIVTSFPGLEAKISWNVSTIHRDGKYVAGMAAYKRHLTFSPWSPQIIADFKERLEPLVIFKNCFQIPVDWRIDEALIKDLVCARLAELDRTEGPASKKRQAGK